MSLKAMTYCWEHSRQTGSRLLMLLAIADFADDEGVAYPGVGRLASKTRMTERNAKRTLHALEASKELTVSYNDGTGTKHGATNQYFLTAFRQSIGLTLTQNVTPKPDGVSPASPDGVSPASPDGVSPASPDGVSPASPKPSVERSVEPSEKEKDVFGVQEVPDNPDQRRATAKAALEAALSRFNSNTGSHWKSDAEIAAEVAAAAQKYPQSTQGLAT